MNEAPYTVEISGDEQRLSRFDNHIVRRLSAMQGQFYNEAAYEEMLHSSDPVLYEVYELERPAVAGELRHGLSIVHAGLVGDEYFMTKGHFHEVLDTAEVYYCVAGQGVMVMETANGAWAIEELRPGSALYVPPNWAHRSVNTDLSQSLITFFVYPGNAGHDYRSIERHGFRKLVLARDGGVAVVDNPRWLAPENR